MNDTLVKIEQVSKKFCRDLKRSLWYGIVDLGNELLCKSYPNIDELRKEEFWAVNNISIELKRGECIGLIGRNGAGKTTLLRMLNGLIKPDKGRIEICGKIGALIALGAGFNPILTGRENIFVNAAVLGLNKKEIKDKFEEIVEFSELGEFIDTPVQNYSSGMVVRLGFSVTTALEPDVLLLDEILAVGDTRFQSKCFKRIKTIINRGGLILLVTHTLEHVAHYCDRALLMDKGGLVIDSNATEALHYYIDNIGTTSSEKRQSQNTISSDAVNLNEVYHNYSLYNPNENRWGDKAATITAASLIQNGQECTDTLAAGLITELKLTVCFHADIEEPIYGFLIKSFDGATLFGTNSRQLLGPSGTPSQNKGDQLKICFRFRPFLDAGTYLISVGIASESLSGIQPHDRRYDSIWLRIAHPFSSKGDIAMNPSFSIIG